MPAPDPLKRYVSDLMFNGLLNRAGQIYDEAVDPPEDDRHLRISDIELDRIDWQTMRVRVAQHNTPTSPRYFTIKISEYK